MVSRDFRNKRKKIKKLFNSVGVTVGQFCSCEKGRGQSVFVILIEIGKTTNKAKRNRKVFQIIKS